MIEDVLQGYRIFVDVDDVPSSPNQKGICGDAPVHIAAYRGDTCHLEIMIAHGGEVSLSGDDGCTPLHYAAMQGHKEAVYLLLHHGADPHIVNSFGKRPFEWAVSFGRPISAEILNAIRTEAE